MYRVKIESSEKDDSEERIPFSLGNPSVEHITGVLHLYKRREDQPPEDEPETATVCVLAVPGDMGIGDFCQFLSSYRPHISSMRMVRRENVVKSTCMSAIEFKDAATARSFVNDYNGRPFCTLEPEIICRVVFTSAVEMHVSDSVPAAAASAGAGAIAAVKAPAGHVELPTCPVCLERLDAHVSGIVTTVCNHKFHNECLQRWGDASCPVCRYSVNKSHDSSCVVCGSTTDLWMCLICGHVGCGRYNAAHARNHYSDTSHCYSLEIESGRVWDYAGDGYVHRLIQSQLDGKLVEVPSPEPQAASARARQRAISGAPAASGGMRKDGGAAASGAEASLASVAEERQSADDLNMLEATYASKMDAISHEYTLLLTSQLESQRAFFDSKMQHNAEQADADTAQLRSELETSLSERSALQARVAKAETRLQGAQKQVAELSTRVQRLQKEEGILTELNRGLIANQQVYKHKADVSAAECKNKDATIQDLQEQVRDLMVYLEGAQVAAGSSELAGGSVQVGEQPKAKGRRGRR